MDYNKMHADWAMQHQPVKNRKVLVIGCNSGLDCRYFVEAGAKSVHGVDVDPGIGRDYQHPVVQYFRVSAEKMDLESDTYDLVYCFATMEHVPDIEAAFNEMARVTKPGGVIYCIASPLWNSRHGHHYPQYFKDYPWAHLRMTEGEALDYLRKNAIAIDPANGGAEGVSSYMFDRNNFNMTPSERYTSVCGEIRNFKILKNQLDLEPEEMLDAETRKELEEKGYSSADLRAVTHYFIARKKQPSWLSKILRR